MSDFDDIGLRAAMRAYLDAADRLERAGDERDPAGVRALLEVAQAKSLAAITLRSRLRELGWTPPPRRAGQGLGIVHRSES